MWHSLRESLAILISLIALLLSYLAYRRSGRYQEFEFRPRLEVASEKIQFSTPSFTTAFQYEATLANQGLKPVDIERVYMDYGSGDDPGKRVKHVVEGGFTLRPGESRPLSFGLSWIEVEQLKSKFGISDCKFFLRLQYRTVAGHMTEAQRSLGGHNDAGTTFMVQAGNRLT